MTVASDDLAAILTDAGEELWFGATVTAALFDEAGSVVQDSLGQDLQILGTTAQIATGALPGLAEESVVTRAATGQSYRVRQILPIGDGASTVLSLAKV